jgi:hypothetical protein
MDNSEYLLQVLRRSHLALQDSLIPVHAEKCHRLIQNFERAPSLSTELETLRLVTGFTRAALAMEWVMRRVKANREELSDTQFERDVELLNDKLFEAFLSEPFDAPAPAQEAADESIIEIEETIPDVPSIPETVPAEEEISAVDSPAAIADTIADREPSEITSPVISEEPTPEPVSQTVVPPSEPDSPPLTELLDQNLLLGFQRFSDILANLAQRPPAERKSAFAVLGMIAKSSIDVARAQGKKDVQDFFESMVTFIKKISDEGGMNEEQVSGALKIVGQKMIDALLEKSNGATLLKNIRSILENPQQFQQE